MKRTLVVLLALSSFGCFAKSATLPTLNKSMKDWQPISVIEDKGVITITLNEAQVTPDIYDSVSLLGICTPLWPDSQKTSYLKNIKEVRVLNKFNYSGYIFESPRAACDEAGKAQPEQSKIIILSHSHLAMRDDLK